MRQSIFVIAFAVTIILAAAGAATAQSGHFVGDVTCEDAGTTLQCDGRVAGLGGTTFEIRVSAPNATADVVCTNPAGNISPGQSFSFNAAGTSGVLATPRNGSFRFNNVGTTTPSPGAGACPNPKWTATVTDVHFSGQIATVNLLENNVVVDSVQVPVP